MPHARAPGLPSRPSPMRSSPAQPLPAVPCQGGIASPPPRSGTATPAPSQTRGSLVLARTGQVRGAQAGLRARGSTARLSGRARARAAGP